MSLLWKIVTENWITILIFLYAFHLWLHRKELTLIWKLKGPFCLPFIGNYWMFINHPKLANQKFIQTLKDYSKYPIFRMWFESHLFIFINSPDYLETILNHPHAQNKDPVSYHLFELYFKKGLLTASSERWRESHKVIAPVFRKSNMPMYQTNFEKYADIIVERLQKRVNNGGFNVFDDVSTWIMDLTCESLHSVPPRPENMTRKMMHCMDKSLFLASIRLQACWFVPDFCLYSKIGKFFTSMIPFVRNAWLRRRFLFQFSQQIMNDFHEAKNSSLTDVQNYKQKPFLKRLIEDSNFPMDRIFEEVNTFTGTATDTTSKTASFMLLMLAMHPDVQDKLYDEIYAIFGSSSRKIEPDDLPKMKYMEMVLKETLRLFPPAPIIGREPSEDIQLDDNVLIPKGCTIFIPIFSLHRNPNLWDNPDEFIPERFAPELEMNRHQYSFMPFSRGPRFCIGVNFAHNMLKYLLTSILRNYKLNTQLRMEDVKLEMNLLLSLHGKFTIEIEERKQSRNLSTRRKSQMA